MSNTEIAIPMDVRGSRIDCRTWIKETVQQFLPEETKEDFESLSLEITRYGPLHSRSSEFHSVQVGYNLGRYGLSEFRRVLVSKDYVFDFGKLVDKIQEMIEKRAKSLEKGEKTMRQHHEKASDLKKRIESLALQDVNAHDLSVVIRDVANWSKEKQDNFFSVLCKELRS